MAANPLGVGYIPAAFLTPGTSSFAELLGSYAPDLLPGRRLASSMAADLPVPHGTTIVALTFPGGVAMAGDRRATMENIVAQRDLEKVFPADDYSCVGFAGAVGIGIEMVRLFQVELEHYEKLQGRTLSLDGKANRIARMIRDNLPFTLQGLAVAALLAGYDLDRDSGRIFSFEVFGAQYEEHDFYSIGSGNTFARGALKKLYRDDLSEADAITACLHALYDAADDDSATGLPDLTRRIFPLVSVVTADGYRRASEEEVGELTRAVVEGRMRRPDGPTAPL